MGYQDINILESENIRLRALEPGDIDLVYRWENDPNIWAVSNTLVPYSRDVLQQFLAQAHQDIYQTRQARLMIDLKENPSRSIGTIDLFDFEPHHGRIGIGILIKEEKDRGKGYARESLELALNYIFKVLLIHQVYCNILEDNTRSLDLFTRLGFGIIGLKKDWIKTLDGWQDEYLLQKINPLDTI
jgi:diamine N-acetyltransferase